MRRRQPREHQRGQRAAARQTVNDADDERSQREGAAGDVDVGGRAGVPMRDAGVRVQPRRAVVGAAQGAGDGAGAEHDQHRRDGELEGVAQRGRQLGRQRREHEAGSEQRRRVADPPQRAEQRAPPRARRVGGQHGDGGQVIGIERVTRAHRHAEQQSDERSRHGLGE